MRLKLSQFGNWAKLMDADAAIYAESNHRATGKGGDRVKNALRADLRAAGIRRAGAMANTWQGKLFPRNAKAHAAQPAYVIGNKLLHVIEQLGSGGVIQFKGGRGVVPMGAGLRLVRSLRPGQPRTAWLALARQQYGDRMVTRRYKGRVQLGVYEKTPAGKSKFVLLGVIVSSVKSPKLLNHQAILRRAGSEFPEEVARETMQQFEERFAQASRRAEFGHVETRIA